jgi:hypothetical protein
MISRSSLLSLTPTLPSPVEGEGLGEGALTAEG